MLLRPLREVGNLGEPSVGPQGCGVGAVRISQPQQQQQQLLQLEQLQLLQLQQDLQQLLQQRSNRQLQDGAQSVPVPVRARRPRPVSTGQAPRARAGPKAESAEAQFAEAKSASPVALALCTPPRSGEAKVASPMQRRRLLSCSSSDNLSGNCSSRPRTLSRSRSMDYLPDLHRPESPAPCHFFRRSRWCRDLDGGGQARAETLADAPASALAEASAGAGAPVEAPARSPGAPPPELGDMDFEFGLEW